MADPSDGASLWERGESLLGGALGGSLHPGGERLSRRLVDRLALRPGHRVLEIGCGSGRTAPLAPAGVEWIGLDPSRRLLRRTPAGLTTVRAAGTSVPLRDGSVDRVAAECALCLLGSWERGVTEAARLLRPAGRLVFSDFAAEGVAWDSPSWAQALCLRAPSEKTVRRVLKGGGFRRVEITDESWSLHELERDVQHRADVLGLLDTLARAEPASPWASLNRLVAQARRARDEGRLRYLLVSATRGP